MSMTGTEIRELRKKLGLSQQAFATKIGVSITSINSWENDRRKPYSLAMKELNKIKEDYNNQEIINKLGE